MADVGVALSGVVLAEVRAVSEPDSKCEKVGVAPEVEQLLTKVCYLFGGSGSEWDEDSEVYTLADTLSQRLRKAEA